MDNSFLKKALEGNKPALLKKEIIRHCIVNGNYTIPDLSREVNMSVPTTTKLISELIDEGFILDFGKQGTNGGRKPNIYGLNPEAGYFAGVDVRPDSVILGMTNFKGQMIESETCSGFTLENSVQSLDRLCTIINSFLDKNTVPRQKVLSVGVNLSGRVNSESGYSYSFYYVSEQPLAAQIEERIDCNVSIENDSRAMTYGEYMCGAAGERNMLFVNASWGLGIGIIIDGKLFYGKSGFSGEYGHFPFFDNEIICRCGKRGCLETEVSGIAAHRLFTEKLREGNVSMLSPKFERGEQITLEDILQAALREDMLAIEIIETMGHKLGKAVSGLINLFNPELIVIGGTLAGAREYLLLPLKSAVNKYSLTLVSKDTTVRLSKLGDRAGVFGACMLVRSKTLGLL